MNRSRPTGKIPAALAALALTAGLGLAGAPPASAAYCGITWGSMTKTAQPFSNGLVTDVRAGRHACFDRLVIDVSGRVSGYGAEYEPVYTPGFVDPIALRGAADLRLFVLASSYDAVGSRTYTPANPKELVDVAEYSTFRQIVTAGSFQGWTDFGVGVRERLPFRVFVLPGPGSGSRLVLDVAHRW